MVRENGTSERTCIIYKCLRIGRKKKLRNGLRIFDFILFKYLDNVYYSQPWIVVIDDSIAIRAEIPWMPKKSSTCALAAKQITLLICMIITQIMRIYAYIYVHRWQPTLHRRLWRPSLGIYQRLKGAIKTKYYDIVRFQRTQALVTHSAAFQSRKALKKKKREKYWRTFIFAVLVT